MAFTPKEAIEIVRSGQNKERVMDDKLRFNVYQGQLKDEVLAFLQREFLRPETIQAMQHRIVPLNITQKIINKLAMVYRESPMRKAFPENENDQMLLDIHSRAFRVNQKMKWANRYFKLHKHTLLEPFLDRDGVPRLRVLPSHTYTPLSDDDIQPERPTGMVKHIVTGENIESNQMRFHYWTDDEFLILDGEGNVLVTEMAAIEADGVNPFGKMPFVYVAENDDGNLIPLSDDDLISMQFVIAALLTDLTYASKYQAWSIFTLTGVSTDQSVNLNPNAVLTLPEGAALTAVKPQVDIQEMLSEVEMLVGLLLTTKNLSVGDITGQVSAANASSGVAKMIDRSETTEDRMDQEQFFVNAEKQLWDLWAHHMLPVYNKSGQIAQEYRGDYSAEFEAIITFPDQKPIVSDKEMIEVEVMKLDNKLTTKKRVLQTLFKDMDDEEIQGLLEEITAEAEANMERFQDALARRAPGETEEEEQDQEQDGESEDQV